MLLQSRNDRRGPFVIQLKNDVYPGRFVLEAVSHLYKMSTKVHRASRELMQQYGDRYSLTSIDDFYALSFTVPVEEYERGTFIIRLKELVVTADEIEERLMKGKDEVVFG
jgi:hypothetical protein